MIREIYEIARDFLAICLFSAMLLAVAFIACGYQAGILQ